MASPSPSRFHAGVAALSHQHERAFSAALIYVLLGAAGAVAMSILDVSPIDPVGDHGLVERLSELALIVAVGSAGLTVERHVRRRSIMSIAVLLPRLRAAGAAALLAAHGGRDQRRAGLVADIYN